MEEEEEGKGREEEEERKVAQSAIFKALRLWLYISTHSHGMHYTRSLGLIGLRPGLGVFCFVICTVFRWCCHKAFGLDIARKSN